MLRDLRASMREYVQWPRGDAVKEAVDIYSRINPKYMQEVCQACVPQPMILVALRTHLF
jgi:hypothetical protein